MAAFIHILCLGIVCCLGRDAELDVRYAPFHVQDAFTVACRVGDVTIRVDGDVARSCGYHSPAIECRSVSPFREHAAEEEHPLAKIGGIHPFPCEGLEPVYVFREVAPLVGLAVIVFPVGDILVVGDGADALDSGCGCELRRVQPAGIGIVFVV